MDKMQMNPRMRCRAPPVEWPQAESSVWEPGDAGPLAPPVGLKLQSSSRLKSARRPVQQLLPQAFVPQPTPARGR